MRWCQYIFLLLLTVNNLECIQISEEVREKLQTLGHIIIHTYQQHYNDKKPCIDGGFVLNPEQIELLGSQNILTDILYTDITQTETEYSRPPIELHFIDKKTFQTILDLTHAYPNLPSSTSFGYTLDALPNILVAVDYLIISKDILLPVLRCSSPRNIAQLCRELNPYPYLFDLIIWTAHQKRAWKPSFSWGNPLVDITAGAIAADGKTFAHGYTDGTINVWQIIEDQWHCVASFPAHIGRINALAITADGQQIFSGSDDHTVKIWQKNSNIWQALTLNITDTDNQLDNCEVTCITITPNGQIYVFGLANGHIVACIRRDTFPHLHWVLNPANRKPVNSVTITTNGDHIVSSAQDGSLYHWKRESTQEGGLQWATRERSYYEITPTEPETRLVAISSDGEYLADIKKNSLSILQRTRFGYQCKQFLYIPQPTALAMTPDHRIVVTGSKEGFLCVYQQDLEKNYFARECLQGHIDEVTYVAICADGSRIVSGSKDGTIIVWELETVEEFCERLDPSPDTPKPTTCWPFHRS